MMVVRVARLSLVSLLREWMISLPQLVVAAEPIARMGHGSDWDAQMKSCLQGKTRDIIRCASVLSLQHIEVPPAQTKSKGSAQATG